MKAPFFMHLIEISVYRAQQSKVCIVSIFRLASNSWAQSLEEHRILVQR